MSRGKALGLEEVKGRVRDHYLFTAMTEDLVDTVLKQSHVVGLSRGEVLFKAGAQAPGCYLLLSGMIQLMVNPKGSRPRVVRFILPGDSFGEAVIFGPGNFPVTAEACMPTKVLFLPAGPIILAMKESWELTSKILESLVGRLKYHIRFSEVAAVADLRLRLATYLLEFHSQGQQGPEGWVDVNVGISRKNLGRALGIAPETSSRLLTAFAAKRLVRLSPQGIHAINVPRLQARVNEIASEPESVDDESGEEGAIPQPKKKAKRVKSESASS